MTLVEFPQRAYCSWAIQIRLDHKDMIILGRGHFGLCRRNSYVGYSILLSCRDALTINSECLGLYDIPPPQYSLEFAQLLNDPELSDFIIEPADGPEIHAHQVIF